MTKWLQKKSKTFKNKERYQADKSLFEIIKEKFKKIYYSRKLDGCEQNIKKTWDLIKELLVKLKLLKMTFWK